MSVASLVLTVVVGLFSGTVGGVLSASEVARRGERGRRQIQAEAALFDRLRDYRNQLHHDHTADPNVHREGERSAAPAQREQLAADVLRQLADTGRRTRTVVHQQLIGLVGRPTIDLMAARIGVPASAIDPTFESHRRFVTAYKFKLGEGDLGSLGQLAHGGNDVLHHADHYRTVEAQLDAAIAAVAPHRRRSLLGRRSL